MRNMFIRRFGFIAGAALMVLGLVFAAIGWGFATIWSPPTSLAVKAPELSVRALHIPPSIAGAGGVPPTISVTPPSGGRVGIAKVRADQATAWLEGLAHDKLTDFSEDSTTFTIESQQGDTSIDPAQLLDADVTSESWLGDRDKPLTHDVVLDGRWSYVVVVRDADKGPADVTLTWAVGMESAASTPFIIAGVALAVVGAIVLALAFRMRAANNEVPEEVSPWNPSTEAAATAMSNADAVPSIAPWQGLKDKVLALAASLPVVGPKIRGAASDEDYSFFDAKKNGVGTSASTTAPATNSIPTTPPLTGAQPVQAPSPGRPPAASPAQTSQYGPATGVSPTYQPSTGAHTATPPATGAHSAPQRPTTQGTTTPSPTPPATPSNPSSPHTTPGTHDDGAPMPWATPASSTPPPSPVPMTPQQAAAHFPPTSALGAQAPAQPQAPAQQPADHASVQHHIDSATTAAQEAVSALPESPRRKAKRERELREQAQREGKTQ